QFRAYVCGQEQLQYLGARDLRAVLGGTLGCAGSASIGAVLERGGFLGAFALDEAGTVGMAWYSTAPVRHPAPGANHSPTVVAAGHLAYGGGTDASVKAKLTRAGRRLLARSRRVALTAVGTFAPVGKPTVRVTAHLHLLEAIYEQCERFTQNVLATEYSWHVTRVVGVSCHEAHRVLEALFVPG